MTFDASVTPHADWKADFVAFRPITRYPPGWIDVPFGKVMVREAFA
jgi:hypothetical protein